MSKFNQVKTPSRKTTSYEGGVVYTKSLENEWFNNLFSSLLEPQYYSEDNKSRYIDLTKQMIDKYGPDFVGKSAIFSRNELGMRSISQLTAAILNDYSWEQKRNFYSLYFHRPDDIGEVFGVIDQLGSKRSHALVRGTADYLATLNDYKLMKYRMDHHVYRMYDLINITHAHSQYIDDFKHNRLATPDTWESLIINEHDDKKREEQWKRLIEEEKLGYLALLRNLRTICKCSFVANRDWVKKYLKPQLTNDDKIVKSLVWPYQIYQAYKSIQDIGSELLKDCLEDAFYTSCQNIPVFDGNTLMILDVSGSMDSPISEKSIITIKEASAVYLASYLIMNTFDSTGHIDVIKFGNTLIQRLSDNDDCGYRTDIIPVFNYIIDDKIKYDRILLFSDMQVMSESRYPYGYGWHYNKDRSRKTANQLFVRYQKDVSQGCKLYSFDLGNYGTQLVSDDNSIRYITSLSNQVFKFIEYDEAGNDFINIIKNYKC